MRARDRGNKVIRRNLLEEAEELHKKALEANNEGNWFAAIGYMEDCTSLAPDQLAYQALLAEFKFNSEDYAGAYDAARKWCKIDKSQKKHRDLRGEKKLTSGNVAMPSNRMPKVSTNIKNLEQRYKIRYVFSNIFKGKCLWGSTEQYKERQGLKK